MGDSTHLHYVLLGPWVGTRTSEGTQVPHQPLAEWQCLDCGTLFLRRGNHIVTWPEDQVTKRKLQLLESERDHRMKKRTMGGEILWRGIEPERELFPRVARRRW